MPWKTNILQCLHTGLQELSCAGPALKSAHKVDLEVLKGFGLKLTTYLQSLAVAPNAFNQNMPDTVLQQKEGPILRLKTASDLAMWGKPNTPALLTHTPAQQLLNDSGFR